MNSERKKHFKRARTFSLVLLFFLGLSALPAAIVMIMDPTGGKMGMPLEMLDHTPFRNFLFPAILLGLFNGILSLFIAILVIRRDRLQTWLVMFQGAVLLVWLTAEVFMKLYYPLLTLPYYLVAVLLITSGLTMRLTENDQTQQHDDQL